MNFFGRKIVKKEEAPDMKPVPPQMRMDPGEYDNDPDLEKFFPSETGDEIKPKYEPISNDFDKEFENILKKDPEEQEDDFDIDRQIPGRSRQQMQNSLFSKAEPQKPEFKPSPLADFRDEPEFPSFEEFKPKKLSESWERPSYPKPAVSKPSPKSESSAPLFVKVDKYNEILTNLQEIKDVLRSVKSVFPLLSEVDDVKKETIETLRIAMQKMEKNMAQLDSDFLMPGKPQLGPDRGADVSHIEDSLSELQSQLNSLRGQLKGK